MRLVTTAAMTFLTLMACGGTTGGNDGGGGGGGSAGFGTCTALLADAGTLGASDAGTACHQLPNCAAEVTFQTASGAAPTATGGTMADGLYALTAVRVYGLTATATTVRVTVLKQGSTIYGISSANGSASAPYTATANFDTSSKMSTLTQTCPNSGTMSRGYAINGDVWLDLDVSSQRTVAYEYTRVH